MSDHYATLGVSKASTQDDIKLAYRKLASQHHPDRAGGDTQKFQEIQAAYAILSDVTKKAEYDSPRPQMNFGFGQNSEHFRTIFEMFGGQGPDSRNRSARMTLWITLPDAAIGGSKTVSIGTTQGVSTVQIEIPLAINDGDNVQYTGIAPGGSDLIIHFRIQPDPIWQRDNLTLYTKRKISIWDLILGTTIQIKNIFGDCLELNIPPGTQPETLMRVRGQGLKNKVTAGDLMLRIHSEIPLDIAPELIDAIGKYRPK